MKNNDSESIEVKLGTNDAMRKIVGVSFDDKYVYPFLVLAHSLKKCSLGDFEIVIANVNQTLGVKSVQIIIEFCSIFDIDLEFRDVVLDFDIQTDNRFSIATYGRLFLMEILKTRFLYLDVDALAHPGWDRIFIDCGEILDKDKVAVVASIAPDAMSTSTQHRYSLNQARQRARSNYFFAMIIFVDPIKLQLSGFSNRWRDAARDYLSLGFMQHDQDVLNYLLHDQVAPLHASYNHLHGLPSVYPRFFSSCVGHPKPWTFSEEDKLIATYTWALGNRDLGKYEWVEDFYAYWNYEAALFTEVSRLNSALSHKLSFSRIENEGSFNNRRARLKYKFARILLGR